MQTVYDTYTILTPYTQIKFDTLGSKQFCCITFCLEPMNIVGFDEL